MLSTAACNENTASTTKNLGWVLLPSKLPVTVQAFYSDGDFPVGEAKAEEQRTSQSDTHLTWEEKQKMPLTAVSYESENTPRQDTLRCACVCIVFILKTFQPALSQSFLMSVHHHHFRHNKKVRLTARKDLRLPHTASPPASSNKNLLL